MADPKILYAVVSVVFAGLAVWLAFVFRSAKEPWAQNPVAKPKADKEAAPAPAVAADEDDDDDSSDEEDDDADADATETETAEKNS